MLKRVWKAYKNTFKQKRGKQKKNHQDLFKKWIKMVPEGVIAYHASAILETFLGHINRVLNKEPLSSKDLQPTQGFWLYVFYQLLLKEQNGKKQY